MSTDGARTRGKTTARFAAVSQGLQNDGEVIDAVTTAAMLRNETRTLMRLAFTALLLTCVAASGTIMILFHPAAAHLASPRDAITLDSSAIRVQKDGDANNAQQHGWYRAVLNTILRRTPDTESERIGMLPIGRAVYVVERRGRRVRIDSPQPGWTSIETEAGVKILEPSPDGGQRHNLTQLDKVFQRIAKDTQQSRVGRAVSAAKTPAEKLTDWKSVEKQLEESLRKSLKGASGIQFDTAGLPDALKDGKKQMEATAGDIASKGQKVYNDVGKSTLLAARSGDKLYVKAKTAVTHAAKERAAKKATQEMIEDSDLKDNEDVSSIEDTSASPSSGMVKALPE